MKFVPQAFFNSKKIKKLYLSGENCIIYKSTDQVDIDNHRLLTNHAITIVTSGSLFIHDDEGLPTTVRHGELVLLPKGLYAITDLIPSNGPFEAIVLFFDEDILNRLLKNLSVNQIAANSGPSVYRQCEELLTFIAQLDLTRQTQTDNELTELKILEALRIISLHSDQNFNHSLKSLLQKPTKKLSSFMEAHYDKPLAIEDFALLTGLSISTFRRSFHKNFSESPKKWLIRKRLELAKEILKNQKLPISQVASQVGYTDIPHFVKSFQKAYHISPLQFAKRNFQS